MTAIQNIPSISDVRLLCQHYLNRIYYRADQCIPLKRHKKNHLSETYGEILYPSIEKLLDIIPLTERDVFVDLGSGLGKIVAQVFLNTPVKSAFGIEIIEELHQEALLAGKQIEKELPEFFTPGRTLSFLLGSFFDINFSSATVAIINSTCFNQPFLGALGQLIDHTPSIHTVYSLRPIATLQRLRFKEAIHVECSWDTSLCYIYHQSDH